MPSFFTPAHRSRLKLTSSFIALLATGALIAPSNSFALDAGALPENGNVVGGAASFDYSTPNTLNVNQGTDRVVINWDSFNIGTNATTQFYQPNSKSLAVNRVIAKGSDPTQILGKLKANGQVMVLDRNGVIFGKDSVVDVGGIIASTGDISNAQVMSGVSKVNISNLGDGEIVNNGTINAGDAGLVGFVGKAAVNNGVINAKLGSVTLAAGEKATVDLYGDGLIEIAANSNLEKAIVENNGTINAEGGTVKLTAAAAKSAVDNVVNMNGVVNVSSVSMKGGKIVLSAGNGTAKVSGKLDASGTKGGSVSVTGKNVLASKTAQISADGKTGEGGSLYLYGDNVAIFEGTLSGRGATKGGEAEISGNEVGYYGLVDLSADNGVNGTLLIDPATLNINNNPSSGIAADNAGGGTGTVNVNAQSIADTLKTTNVNLWATNDLNITSNVDFSTWAQSVPGPLISVPGPGIFMPGPPIIISIDPFITAPGPGVFIPGPPILVPGPSILTQGITSNNLTLAAPTVNISHDVVLGTGQLKVVDLAATTATHTDINAVPAGGVHVDTLNLDGKILKRSVVAGATTLANDDQLVSAAGTINVQSDAAKISQALNFADNALGAVINVAAGTYNEAVSIAKNNITLNGAKSGVAGNDASRGTGETIVSGTGFSVTGNDNSIDGFKVTNSTNGVSVTGGTNNKIKNNIVTEATQYGIKIVNAASSLISGNKVNGAGKDGIFVDPSPSTVVNANVIDNTVGSGVNIINSINSTVSNNLIGTLGGANNIGGDGIDIVGSTGTSVTGNTVKDVARAGIYNKFTPTVTIDGNHLTNIGLIGISSLNSAGGVITISNNTINKTGQEGIRQQFGDNGFITGNTLGYGADGLFGTADDAAATIGTDGIRITGMDGTEISGNHIANTGRNGIYASYGPSTRDGVPTSFGLGLKIGGIERGNVIDNTGNAGVRLLNSEQASVVQNRIGTQGGNNNINGDGIIAEYSNGATVSGNTISETTSTGLDVGSGVYLKNSGNSTVANNDISNTEWDGVKISRESGYTITDNVFNDVTRVGLYADHASDYTARGNTIDGTGIDGIRMFTMGANTLIDTNSIDNTNGNGISVAFSSPSSIVNNFVGTGAGSVIAQDGIHVNNSTGATISGNDVRNTKRVGIYSTFSTDTTVSNNKITNADLYGVRLLNVFGVNMIDGNDINDVTLGGVSVIGADDISILNNFIGVGADKTAATGDDTSAGLNGISVANSLFADIVGNLVANAATNGVFVDMRAGGTATLSGNEVTNSDVGMRFHSGLIDLTGAANTITGGSIGMLFSPTPTVTVEKVPVFDGPAFDGPIFSLFALAPVSTLALVNDTVGTSIFNNQSVFNIQLENGALFDPGAPTLLDATNATFDGFQPSANGNLMSQAQFDLIQNGIFDFNDDGTLGLFFFGNVLPPSAPTIDQSNIFQDILGIPGSAGRFSITITGLPRLPGAGAPIVTANNNVGGGTFSLNNITPAAGGDENAPADNAGTPQNVEPSAGGAGNNNPPAQQTGGTTTTTNCWGDAVAAASNGQSVTYGFDSSNADALSIGACSNPS